MAYRDSPERQMRRAADAVARLEALRVPWRMGVLCNDSKEVGVSYFGRSANDFEAQMQVLTTALRPFPLCRGLIIENYHSLRALLQQRSTQR